MKNLITIWLLLATSTMMYAQTEKPSKEETIAFIQKTMESAIGNRTTEGIIIENSFDYSSVTYKTTMEMSFDNFRKFTYTQIKWENLIVDRIWTETVPPSPHLICIGPTFSNNVTKHVRTEASTGYTNDETTYQQKLRLYIPKEKVQSIIKACIRLSELAKEENKDPFEN